MGDLWVPAKQHTPTRRETVRHKLYRLWLYHGPGFKSLRRALRINDQVLPLNATINDSVYSGRQAISAEHAVEELREKLVDPGMIADYPQAGQVKKAIGDRKVIVSQPVVVANLTEGRHIKPTDVPNRPAQRYTDLEPLSAEEMAKGVSPKEGQRLRYPSDDGLAQDPSAGPWGA
jgi:hypothetical protein